MLHDHLVRGFSVNERQLDGLRQSLYLVEHALEGEVSTRKATALLRVLTDYALDLLDDYDQPACDRRADAFSPGDRHFVPRSS